MSHPFGDLLAQYLHRKHGLSQAKLAEGILQAPSIISSMCQGKRLQGTQARERVVAILVWLQQQGVLSASDDANALLAAAGMSVLNELDPTETRLLSCLRGTLSASLSGTVPPDPSRPNVSPIGQDVIAQHVTTRHNLPKQMTSLIGRETELMALVRLLPSTLLLSLIGVGGVGKTRLAQEVGFVALDQFPGGVWYIQLATVADPALLPWTLAQTLRLPEKVGQTDLALLTRYFENRAALLILDNCEHLLQACSALVNQLLQTSAHLRVLVTSREPLNIPAEMVWQVTPLSIPAASLLFVERAHRVQPDFVQSDQAAAAITHICTRLDGIPLAIELAASRLYGLSLAQILSRLNTRFALLTQGSRTALPRHQTLRAMIDWSSDLLADAERTLLRRLAVFSGGWTLEAAETVCTDIKGPPIMDLHTQLVQKSLVVMAQSTSETRYHFLETIREYALEKLEASGERHDLDRRHGDYFLQLTRAAEPHLHSTQQKEWLDRLEQDHDNFRAVLQWSHTNLEDPDFGLQMVAALWQFWWMRGHLSEGRRWIQELLNGKEADTSSNLYAWALLAMGILGMEYFSYGGYHADVPLRLEQALAIFRTQNDVTGMALALCELGNLSISPANPDDDYTHGQRLLEESLVLACHPKTHRWIEVHARFALANLAYWQLDLARSSAIFEACVALARQVGDKQMIGVSLNEWGDAETAQLRFAHAATLSEEALHIFRETINPTIQVQVLQRLGFALLFLGKFDQARAYAEEMYRTSLEYDLRNDVGGALTLLGIIAQEQGEYAQAISLFKKSLAWFQEKVTTLTNWSEMAMLGLGTATSLQGQHPRAARLFGVIEAWQQRLNWLQIPANQSLYGRHINTTRATLGDIAYEAAFAEGQAMTQQQAFTFAMDETA